MRRLDLIGRWVSIYVQNRLVYHAKSQTTVNLYGPFNSVVDFWDYSYASQEYSEAR
jgi:hypothetical protein